MSADQTLTPVEAPRRAGFRPFGWLGALSETRYWAYFVILPSLLLVLAVVVYPVLSGIGLSFQEKRLNRPERDAYIGTEHYAELLEDRNFQGAVRNTVIWAAAGVTSQFLLGLITALALNRGLRGTRLARVLVLLPWVMPSVVAGNIWALMLDSRLGVINDILVKLGVLDTYHAWFSDPDAALPVVLLVALWQAFPFFTLMLLAGLQGIPDDLYEAAAVDGANPLHQFWYITLPLLRPIIIATVVLRTIGMVNSPDLLIILTNGGPGRATQMVSLYAFQTAYNKYDYGYAGAISVVILALLLVFTVIYVRVSGAAKE